MRQVKRYVVLSLVLQLLAYAPPADAMILFHYDLASLIFLSTDIVIASISESADHKFSTTVTESLYGTIKPGEKLDTLTPFLTFFRPMESGLRVILFLDRRPHQYDFLNSEAAKSPFAVPPSGVYLIDEYDHVHEYYQQNNPGPYVAQLYSYFIEESVPTREQDLTLPNLADVKARIATTVVSVDRVRPLLEKIPAPADFPSLLQLIDTTSPIESDCNVRMASAIEERALENVHSLQDPARYLIALSTSGPYGPSAHATDFLLSGTGTADKESQDSRIRLLLETLTNKNSDSNLRIASAEILVTLSKFHSGAETGPSQALPIANDWLKDFATKIQSTAKSIFDDPSEDPRLRSLSVEFLDMGQPPILADARAVYAKTQSGLVRFAVEKSFLLRSDTLYASLNPPGGPVASNLSPLPESVCSGKLHKSLGFRLQYQSRMDYADRGTAFRPAQAILTNLKTHRRYEVEKFNTLGGWYGMAEGQTDFELDSLDAVPPGDYSLALVSIPSDGQPATSSYTIGVSIRETPAGKILTPAN